MPGSPDQTSDNHSVLGKISVEDFLSDYWQKKPLLIRQAIPAYQSPISPDELAGLACNEYVESRIVLEKDRIAPWSVLHGPFYESDFSTMPNSHWTLLVQECNTHVPELAMLLEKFNFIPNWRIDDVMVSYAADQGSVGPHVDQYDVFLLQGMGVRHWQINTHIDRHAAYLEDTELRILKNFESEQEWLLEPGDMLYLPPGVAHYGIARGECMTISVGFRAPDYYSMLSGFIDNLYSSVNDPFSLPRYQDPTLKPQSSCGEISQQCLQSVIEIIQSSSNDSEQIKHWFGQFITEPKVAFQPVCPDAPYTVETLREACRFEQKICRLENARYAYIRQNENQTLLFINGEEFVLHFETASLAKIICDHRRIGANVIAALLEVKSTAHILLSLFNRGYLYFDDM